MAKVEKGKGGKGASPRSSAKKEAVAPELFRIQGASISSRLGSEIPTEIRLFQLS